MRIYPSILPEHEPSVADATAEVTIGRVETVATFLHGRGLTGLALIGLEILDPFRLIGAQMMIAAQPALRLFGVAGWGESFGEWAALLESPEGADQLRAQLHRLNTGTTLETSDSIEPFNRGE